MSGDCGNETSTELIADFPWGFPLSPKKKGGYTNYSSKLETLIEDTEKIIKICVPFVDEYGFTRLQELINLNSGHIEKKIVIRDVQENVLKRMSDSDWDIYTLNEKDWGFHAKYIIFDNENAVLGSSNLTERSLKRNLEVGVYTNEKDIVNNLVIIYKLLVKHSEDI